MRSILFVRNRDQKWWCVPGGGWNHTRESILECTEREVFEETGVQVNTIKLLYVQTLYIKKQNSTWLELFWLAQPVGDTGIPRGHTDQYGAVSEARWFSKEELQTIIIYPEILKNTFWDIVDNIYQEENRYLGHFIV